jgi:hypothetical protein
MTGYEKEIEYYFCEAKNNFTENYGDKYIFFITPKDYFDKTGFLSDRGDAVPPQDVPKDFQRVSDSTFEYVGNSDPIKLLLLAKKFAWRDMGKEVKYIYERRRLLGRDNQE